MIKTDVNDQYSAAGISNCKNCNNPVNEKFCSHCGQATHLRRIDKHYISHEVFHLFHFEKGFFYSVRELITRPGDTIREFVKNNRTKHMKPVAFLILSSLLYTLITHVLKADELNNGKEKLDFGKSSIPGILHWVQEHYGYANIIMSTFIALCIRLLFRKYKYNFFEIAVLVCFVIGEAMLLVTIVSCFYKVLNYRVYTILFSLIGFGYATWAIGDFFDKKKIASYIKAFLAYFLGYIMFYMLVIIIGLITDLVMK